MTFLLITVTAPQANQSKWHRKDAEFLRVERDQAYDRPEGRAGGVTLIICCFYQEKSLNRIHDSITMAMIAAKANSFIREM